MRRGQAALEFLTTYGWAFLIILVMMGTIAYFGVLNPSTFLPEKCEVSAGFSCDDFMLAMPGIGAEVEIKLTNGHGKTVVLERMEVRYEDQSGDISCGDYHDVPFQTTPGIVPYTLTAGKSTYMVCNPGPGSIIKFPGEDQKVKVKFSFNYTFAGKPFQHYAEGEIYGTVHP